MHIKYGKSVDSWYNNDRGVIYLQRQVNHGIVPQKHTQTVRIIIAIMYVQLQGRFRHIFPQLTSSAGEELV